jgi:membrane fusion protein (multidrug efflux system)
MFVIYMMFVILASRPFRAEEVMQPSNAQNVLRLEMRQEAPLPEQIGTAPPRKRRLTSRTLTVSLIALLAGGAGIFWIVSPASSQTTDDAYVEADSTNVAPKIRGLVEQITVRDNQSVHTGDLLLRIDPEEFDAKVSAAKANLADAEAAVASARAAVATQGAEEQLAVAEVGEAGTAIRSADAEAERAAADRSRTDALAARGFASRQTLDSFRSQAIGAEQAAAKARAALAVSQRQASLTQSRRAGLLADVEKAEAQRLAAQAALDLALQDRTHALIRAPVDGVVANRQVRVGDYVQPGSRLLTLVPVQTVYVTANFKETQVRDMRRGQAVRVKVDALGRTLDGVVESFAPGSGSTFSLLPFEPGTGNFTKIVQRVPVRIGLRPNQPGLDELRAGLSASVTVRVRA